MKRQVRAWITSIHKEFGILPELIEVDPEKLWADETELPWGDKVDALAYWCMYNDRSQVPLVIAEGEKIECENDLLQIFQAG